VLGTPSKILEGTVKARSSYTFVEGFGNESCPRQTVIDTVQGTRSETKNPKLTDSKESEKQHGKANINIPDKGFWPGGLKGRASGSGGPMWSGGHRPPRTDSAHSGELMH